MTLVDLGPALRSATQRLVRAVDGLPDPEWSGGSLLPGWSRAQVVAHLTQEATATAAALHLVLDRVGTGTRVCLHASPEERREGLAALVVGAPDDLRERLLGSTTVVAEALARLAEAALEDVAVLDRVVGLLPGGPDIALGDLAAARLHEVEVHHVDLATGRTPGEWEEATAASLLDAMAARLVGGAAGAGSPGVALVPDDDPRRWSLGPADGDPVLVRGPLRALAWWATGRPLEPVLPTGAVHADGALPRIETW